MVAAGFADVVLGVVGVEGALVRVHEAVSCEQEVATVQCCADCCCDVLGYLEEGEVWVLGRDV